MYERTVLPNGIRVVTEYIPHVRSVSLGVWVETGSRDEKVDQRGFAHFIEHMMFKGTRKYSARDIAEIMDTSGGHLNAFTGKEQTCYYARVLDEQFPVAADILQEMLLNSTFSQEELDKERGVILEEIKMYEDTPDELVHDLLAEAIWADHPLGSSILGTKESILGVTRQNLLDFMGGYYTTDRIVIAAAGNIRHDQVISEFASVLEGLPNKSFDRKDVYSVKLGETVLREKQTEQVHLCLGGPALCRQDKRKHALYLLDTIVGGGMSSRLFQELREERGLVYSTYSYHSSYRDGGSFGIYAGCGSDNSDQVVQIIQEQLTKLTTESVPEEELERAKSQLKGSLMLALESTTNRMTRLAKDEINYGKLFGPDEIVESIDKVSLEDIQELAEFLYQPQNWSIALIGPVNRQIRSESGWRKIG